ANIEPVWPRGLNWPAARTCSSIPSRARACCTALSIPSSDISAVTIPRPEERRRVHRPAVDVDLEVEVAAHRAGVAGPADAADDLADVHEVAAMEGRRMDHVGVPVLAPLPQSPDHHVIAVESCV